LLTVADTTFSPAVQRITVYFWPIWELRTNAMATADAVTTCFEMEELGEHPKVIFFLEWKPKVAFIKRKP
jgi:hypothetical protein